MGVNPASLPRLRTRGNELWGGGFHCGWGRGEKKEGRGPKNGDAWLRTIWRAFELHLLKGVN